MNISIPIAIICWAALQSAPGAETPHAMIAFPGLDQAKAAIIDESMEPYFSLLQPQEMSSKTGAIITGATLEEKRATCRQRYQAAVRIFSPAEQAGLTEAINMIYPILARDYPLFAAEPWQFVKVDPGLEGGLPCTRAHSILLSDTVMRMFTHGPGQKPDMLGVMVLVHEQCHVVQRHYPQLFAELFTTFWGFTRMPKEPTATGDLLAHQLVNPDGVSCVWALPITMDGTSLVIQPQLVFGSDRDVPRMPADFRTVALTVEKHGNTYAYHLGADGRPEQRPLESVSAYMGRFAPSEENFHPNEISAELLSREVLMDALGIKSPKSTCVAKLREWAKRDLAQAP